MADQGIGKTLATPVGLRTWTFIGILVALSLGYGGTQALVTAAADPRGRVSTTGSAIEPMDASSLKPADRQEITASRAYVDGDRRISVRVLTEDDSEPPYFVDMIDLSAAGRLAPRLLTRGPEAGREWEVDGEESRRWEGRSLRIRAQGFADSHPIGPLVSGHSYEVRLVKAAFHRIHFHDRDQRPVPGVRVSLSPAELGSPLTASALDDGSNCAPGDLLPIHRYRSGSDGIAVINDVTPGKYFVSVQSDSYLTLDHEHDFMLQVAYGFDVCRMGRIMVCPIRFSPEGLPVSTEIDIRCPRLGWASESQKLQNHFGTALQGLASERFPTADYVVPFVPRDQELDSVEVRLRISLGDLHISRSLMARPLDQIQAPMVVDLSALRSAPLCAVSVPGLAHLATRSNTIFFKNVGSHGGGRTAIYEANLGGSTLLPYGDYVIGAWLGLLPGQEPLVPTTFRADGPAMEVRVDGLESHRVVTVRAGAVSNDPMAGWDLRVSRGRDVVYRQRAYRGFVELVLPASEPYHMEVVTRAGMRGSASIAPCPDPSDTMPRSVFVDVKP